MLVFEVRVGGCPIGFASWDGEYRAEGSASRVT